VLAWWDRIERWAIGLIGAAALLICLWQIVGRYISNRLALPWGEELSVYVIVWAVFLTGSALIRDDGHVRADLILRMLAPERQRWLELINCTLALAFCVGLTWYGWLVTEDAWVLSEVSNTVLRFPMWLYYACLPTGAALMTVRYAIRLYRYAFAFDPATMEVQSGRES
jgi:C4-dicarboxylate transporter, DctQ subunit